MYLADPSPIVESSVRFDDEADLATGVFHPRSPEAVTSRARAYAMSADIEAAWGRWVWLVADLTPHGGTQPITLWV